MATSRVSRVGPDGLTREEVVVRSWQLRQVAHEMERQGALMQSFAYYVEAHALHAPDDHSREAAAARHDLAESYMVRPDGIRVDNLRKARALLELALKSEARREDLLNHALSRSSLGKCLRQLAGEPLNGHERRRLLEEAEEEYRQAIDTLTSLGGRAMDACARARGNYANLLDEMGKRGAAINAAREALGAAEAAERLGVARDSDLIHHMRLTLARLLVECGDTPETGELLRPVLQAQALALRARARLLLARAALVQGKTELARAQLSRVKEEVLAHVELPNLASAWKEAGERKRGMELLQRRIEAVIDARTRTIADVEADAMSRAAQSLARVLAEEMAADGDAVGAFLALENSSGLRFEENFGRMVWVAMDPVTRELAREADALASLAGAADQLAGVGAIAYPPEFERVFIGAWPLRGWPSRDEWVAALAEAAGAVESGVAFAALTKRLVEREQTLRQRLRERDPSFDTASRPVGFPVTREELAAIASRERGSVLVRVSVTDRVVMAAVWYDADRLVGRVHAAPLPEDFWSRVEDDADKGGSGAFEAVDLSHVLHSGPTDRLVVLPCGLAGRLPLAAVGPQGARPMDLAQSVVWLPNLAPLRIEPPRHRGREGRVLVIPENTEFHNVAAAAELTNEHTLRAPRAEEVYRHVQSADVFAFYGHGQHLTKTGPALDLNGEKLAPWRDSEAWRGLERAELWACQTGVDDGNDARVPFVDEFFGLDAEFLQRGVRTTIASLRAVPDLPTAAIVHRYRRGLAAGTAADVALLEAQRWWRDTGVSDLMGRLRTLSVEQAGETFIASLGLTLEAGTLGGLLGPASGAEEFMNTDAVDDLERRWSCPSVWAAFRFVGIPDRRPTRSWPADADRALTGAEEKELDALLARARD